MAEADSLGKRRNAWTPLTKRPHRARRIERFLRRLPISPALAADASPGGIHWMRPLARAKAPGLSPAVSAAGARHTARRCSLTRERAV
jgi:hypothetical protein